MSKSVFSVEDKPQSLAGLRVLVIGLGRFGGGVGVTRWLVGQGAIVTVTDQASGQTLAESLGAVADLDITLHLGGHDPRDLKQIDLVVVNPAVNKDRSELFQEIVHRNVAWTTEMNLFCERCPATIIGVTGTYGKSTTCAMLADALSACRRAGGVEYSGVHLGGNIGRSLLTELDGIRPTDLVVLEMSSAQLEDLPRIGWAPPIAVITNLSPHHFDRHPTYTDYVAAKLKIVGDPRLAGKAVVGDMDPEAEAILRHLVPGRVGSLVRVTRPDPPLGLRAPGDHNQWNAACALAVCHHLGLDEDVVRDALRSFKGLPHRLEHVRTLDRVDYYNDSKSTSPPAAATAIATLKRPIVAIVGGHKVGRVARPDDASPAHGRVGSYGPDLHLRSWANTLARACRLVICMGESGPAIAQAVRAAEGTSRHSIVREVGGLQAAVRLARAEAEPGDAVLFSPGAPSFDAYANFAERGRRFTDAVNALSPLRT